MPKRTPNKNIRKLTKLGGHTLAVSIPIEIIRDLKWRERQKVVVKKIRGGVVIKDWPARRSSSGGGKK